MYKFEFWFNVPMDTWIDFTNMAKKVCVAYQV